MNRVLPDTSLPALQPVLDSITRLRKRLPGSRSVLVGISGIDASGKGHITRQMELALHRQGLKVANINVDGWLNLPHRRFSKREPAAHFYRHALRLPEMFERLVLPLQTHRSVDITVDFAEETATAFRPHRYRFDDVDIVLLEGIFLFQPDYLPCFDLRIWIECGFATALQRAISRAQEGLPETATIDAYRTIYFPAQKLHFRNDRPREQADLVLLNDPAAFT